MTRTLALPLLLALAACDPQGPGARGTITLGATATTAGASSLEIRAFASTAQTFAPSNAIPAPVFCNSETLPVPLASVTFSYDYEIDCGVGLTTHRKWQV